MPPKGKKEPKVKKERKNAGKRGTKGPKDDDDADPVFDPDDTPSDILRKIGIICTYAQSSKKLHRNTRDIAVSGCTMTFHGQPMVEEAELTLNYGNRYVISVL